MVASQRVLCGGVETDALATPGPLIVSSFPSLLGDGWSAEVENRNSATNATARAYEIREGPLLNP